MGFRTSKMPVLQEKSASGSVATFNTALAMPLPSCNIAVNAWQEGSGDPSPDNVRPIHGFSEVNATRAGKNLANIAQEAEKRKNGEFLFTLVYEGSKVTIETSTTASLYVLWGLFQIPKSLVGVTVTLSNSGYDTLYLCRAINADYSGTITDLTSRTVKTYTFSDSDVGSYLGIRFINGTGSDKYVENVQLEVGSIATAYEPYVTPTIYTIQLGQEVYGAEVDVVNGVAHVTHAVVELDGSSDENWTYRAASNGFMILVSDMKPGAYMTNGLANWLPIVSRLDTFGVVLSVANKRIYCNQITNDISGVTDVDTWRTYLSTHPLQVDYPIETPFDIQLTPQQVQLLKDNNTLYADTGDVDLTYKDLDIAKRGNFREVFKLPN